MGVLFQELDIFLIHKTSNPFVLNSTCVWINLTDHHVVLLALVDESCVTPIDVFLPIHCCNGNIVGYPLEVLVVWSVNLPVTIVEIAEVQLVLIDGNLTSVQIEFLDSIDVILSQILDVLVILVPVFQLINSELSSDHLDVRISLFKNTWLLVV